MAKFHDPIAPKKKEDGKKPWSFKAPSYDNRSSCSISAGDDYGIGFKTPVGSMSTSGKSPIPMKPMRMKADEVVEREKEG